MVGTSTAQFLNCLLAGHDNDRKQSSVQQMQINTPVIKIILVNV